MLKNFLPRLSYWYFTKRALPYWCILLLDCFILVLMGFLVYFFQNGAESTSRNIGHLALIWMVYLIPYIIAFRLFHTYSGVIRYSSFVDLQRVGFAMMLATAFLIVGHLVYPWWHLQEQYYRISGLILVCILSTGVIWMMRVLVKFMYDAVYHSLDAKKVFVYGVHRGGASIAKSLLSSQRKHYILAGFITADKRLEKRWMMGVKVYTVSEGLVEQMVKMGVSTLMVSPLCVEMFRENTKFMNDLALAGIHVLMLPQAQEWDGHRDLNAMSLKEVDIEDLLLRDKIEIDLEAVGNLLKDKMILITGAAGSIGSEIVRQVASFVPKELLLIDQAETPLHDIRLMMAKEWPEIKAYTVVADICMKERMEELFKKHRPDYVFHAAAYKHVPMMEDNPGESVHNNVWGTRVIADLSVKYGAKKFVMVSTDKAVNPTNVMGCSKRICEIYVQSLDKAIKDGVVKGETQFVTTRFGNVLGSNGSVIPLFKKQIKQGGPVTVTHKDIIRYFMLIPEACKLVLEAGTMGNGGEIYVFDMGKPVKIVDLARRMIQLSGAKNIEIKFTGLRDGEKLYEEVLNEAETTKPTFHPKIKIAQVREYVYGDVLKQIESLVAASYLEDMEIVKRMKEIVPEFKSQHSIYEQLDKK